MENNEHKEIEFYYLTDNLGVLIKFIDGSHTYLDPEMMRTIFNDLLYTIEKRINEEE